MFRANVLSLLPKQFDLQGKWTGKYIVNSAELPANAQHTVTLREKTGNSAIQSAGATLLLVYRVLDPTEPLRKIVVYDGLYTAYDGVVAQPPEADVMSQHIRGFYKSAGTSARITHIVGTGGNNQTEKITVQATQQDDQYRPTAEFERSVSTDESEFGPLMGESHVQPRRAEPRSARNRSESTVTARP